MIGSREMCVDFSTVAGTGVLGHTKALLRTISALLPSMSRLPDLQIL